MQRNGSPLTGVGTVLRKELADNLNSMRMRLLEILICLAGIAAIYQAATALRAQIGQDRFVFLHVFTVAQAPLPSSVAFFGFLIPIVAIALGFDTVNGEFGRRTMSRILAQPIYRDALLFGKFLAGLATLAIVLVSLWLIVVGLGMIMLGVPPGPEEVLRSAAFLVASIAYGGVWLALAMIFSTVFRSAATAALSALAVWLLFAFFWQMIVPLAANALAPPDPYDPMSQLHSINVAMGLSRLSPNTLYAETAQMLLNPSTRALGPILTTQVEGALIGQPLPFMQSALLVWPQLAGLIAGCVLLFTGAYLLFQRQEVRA
jgi:ABC-2 type transport system permease protein